jgi:hypothetical protein
LILVCVELVGAPLPVASLDVPDIYRVLAAAAPGGVVELPLGYRDGFGETGDFDDSTLFYQTMHRHPMAGGFVARLSPVVRQAYDDDPVLRRLLAASASASIQAPSCGEVLPSLWSNGFRYVVVDRARLTGMLAAAVAEWPLTPVAASGGRELFRLRPQCASNRPGSP